MLTKILPIGPIPGSSSASRRPTGFPAPPTDVEQRCSFVLGDSFSVDQKKGPVTPELAASDVLTRARQRRYGDQSRAFRGPFFLVNRKGVPRTKLQRCSRQSAGPENPSDAAMLKMNQELGR